MDSLLDRVQFALKSHRLALRGEKILVAVSGGLDSMVLLNLLSQCAPVFAWKLTVAHFNHQLRGRSADADERFVKSAARKLGLPCITDRADVRSHARSHGLSLEMSARQLRHEFLVRTARARNIRLIALAHHADDQAELVLLRLLRGSGPDGLAGMKWSSPSPADSRLTLMRPLLSESKLALRKWATRERIAFREDASNAQLEILRNRVRHELLPLLARRYQPAIHKILLRQAELLDAESEFVVGIARRWLDGRRRPKFDSLPLAIQRRAVQLQLAALGVSPTFELIEQLRRAPNIPVAIGPRQTVSRKVDGTVRIVTAVDRAVRSLPRQFQLKGRAGEIVFANRAIRWNISSMDGRIRGVAQKRVNSERFDADKVGNVIELRHWRPGDRFQPIGMARAAKLQNLFVNQKIPRDLRQELVVATTRSGDIFWVEGLRMAERYKLDNSTRRGLNWTWKGV